MDGRVKTLHPKLYAGLLARRDDPAHMVAAEEHEIEFVDLVCVNLYPFEETAARRGVDRGRGDREHRHRRPDDDPRRGEELRRSPPWWSSRSPTTRSCRSSTSRAASSRSPRASSLAAEAFAYTARYDSAIARWFAEKLDDFPPVIMGAYEKVIDLAYGENPHQRAAYYQQVGARMHVLSMVRQLGGKELSFNNVLDLNAARLLVQEFELPACAIIKHNNPCGCAVAGSAVEAYERAFACDPLSAFGGVIASTARSTRSSPRRWSSSSAR